MTSPLLHALRPSTWARECLHITLDPWQVDVVDNPGKNRLLLCSRQAGKSFTCAVLGLHHALYHPNAQVLILSPSIRQSGLMFQTIGDLMELLPDRVKKEEDNKLSCRFTQNKSSIHALPGTAKTIRGYSPTLILIDEAAQVEDSLVDACRPMAAVTHSPIILLSSPFGRRGIFFELFTNGGPEWSRTRVPATECPRISPLFLEHERQEMTPQAFESEYMCSFIQNRSAIFSYDMLQGLVDQSIPALFTAGPGDHAGVMDTELSALQIPEGAQLPAPWQRQQAEQMKFIRRALAAKILPGMSGE